MRNFFAKIDAYFISVAQSFSDWLAERKYYIPSLLRDASCLALAAPVSLCFVQFSDLPKLPEAWISFAFTLLISYRLVPLIILHHYLSLRGWTEEIKNVYRVCAQDSVKRSFPVRFLCLLSILGFSVYVIVLAYVQKFLQMDFISGYFCMLSYTALSYFECVQPPQDNKKTEPGFNRSGTGWRVSFG